jgi:hypothetical protein
LSPKEKPMRLAPTRTETSLLLGCAVVVLLALWLPPLAQSNAHGFADARTLWGIPHALDVLSNLPFAVAGGLGLAALARVPADALSAVQRGCAKLSFVGLVVTALGSSWYHWAPDHAGLAIDRLGMSVAFAGLLGLVAATHVSDRAGRALLIAVAVLAPASVAGWFATGNVLPWALVQIGGMTLLVVAALLQPRESALRVRWGLVLLAYAVAKLFEANDHSIYAATGQLFSGHTLKHLTAAFAAWPVIAAVAARARRQNGPKAAAQPA